ncbi:MAG: ABC transporter ATP-binding protein [Thaumarchaeota archaeon]|nr:ABC transporter ATP-binding protein [Nitrososphaerota archaeon]
MSQENIVEVHELRKWFPLKGGLLQRTRGYVKAVDDVTLVVKRGETTGLVGESGCGKTTMARTMMRLTDATEGRIIFDGVDITRVKGRKLKPYRRRMQVVFQDPYASLDPRQSVISALTEPMKLHRLISNRSEGRTAAERLIDLVGLNRDHLDRFPHEFSGGQRQRIAIARALAVQPEFVLLDEPTSSLDVSVQAQILNLLGELQKEFSLTYLFISHNLSVIRYMCHRIAVMYLGHIVEIADRDSIYGDPRHPYTFALLGSAPVPDPKERKGIALLEGDVPSPIDIPSGCRFRTRCPYATAKCAKEVPVLRAVAPGHYVECHYDIDFRSKVAVEAKAT